MAISLKKAFILGGGGFTGREIFKILLSHPFVDPSYVTSELYAGERVLDIYPNLDLIDLPTEKKNICFKPHPKKVEDIPSDVQVVFLACPEQVAMDWAPKLLRNKCKVIDMGGSFRLPDVSTFNEFYKLDHSAPQILKSSVYGMTEVYRKEISNANMVANPGCYPTSVLLPLWTMKRHFSYFKDPFIIDSKSGTSGAGGRKEKDMLSFSNTNENFRAYRVADHQHAPEMQYYLNEYSDNYFGIRFIPYLLPVFRGIFSTIYIRVKNNFDPKKLLEDVVENTQKETFLRYYKEIQQIQLQSVQYTNYIDFSFHFDKKNNLLTVVSAIDNLLKGAAGQAIQNMNLMLGFEEITGFKI